MDDVAAMFGIESLVLPAGPVLVMPRRNSPLADIVFGDYDPAEVVIDEPGARADVRWVPEAAGFLSYAMVGRRSRSLTTFDLDAHRRYSRVLFPAANATVKGENDLAAVALDDDALMLPNSPFTQYMHRLRERTGRLLSELEDGIELAGWRAMADIVRTLLDPEGRNVEDGVRLIRQRVTADVEASVLAEPVLEFLNIADAADAIEATNWKVFDPAAWRRRGGY
jgi:hypothetical protein